MKCPLFKMALAGAICLSGSLLAAPGGGVAIIANNSVPLDTISAAALKDIYIGKTTYWPDGQSVVIAVLADPTRETDLELRNVSGMDASHFETFWERMVFSGRGKLPKSASDISALVALVSTTKGAIAFVPADTRLKDVKRLATF